MKEKVWLAATLAAMIAWMGDEYILKAVTSVIIKIKLVIILHMTNTVTSILTDAILDQSQSGTVKT